MGNCSRAAHVAAVVPCYLCPSLLLSSNVADTQERIVADSQQMIPRTRKQLEEAHAGLQDLVDALKDDKAVSNSQEFQDAFSILQQVETACRDESQ